MRWLRRVLGGNQVQPDPGRQEELLREVRQRFGANPRARIPDQVEAVVRLLDGDDGLVVATRVLRECADEAHAQVLAQAVDLRRRTGRWLEVDRRNYRPLWRAAGAQLRWPLFTLPGGLHPYVQVAAAVTVVGARAPRVVRVTDPGPLLAHVFELFDLTVAGWEYGRVRVDPEGAALASGLISAAAQILAAMDDPPRLPPCVRELMRRNNTTDVHDPTGPGVVGGINLGADLRASLLA